MKEKKIVFHIHQLLEERNMSMRELGRLSDIDISKLSPLVNGKRQRVDIGHLQRIAEALDLDDINSMISIETIEND
ncbi:helix-turn-helix domain-containing protein [Marinilactibacillus psychrotolerans]|uniref:Transcriptional regulator, Cro/CI family n=2 Tax=Marinilactibacillus TaxID=191769 RepID=A0A1R4ITE4_9LACT|nr:MULTISPECIES: helix-turn-helix transcriptional regulator [Marinilactibacillus]API89830.1 transcriptional regulator [Marinilactibacillus sp. 15R]SJN23166.1 transcriptional regulator, Cro/CI family [Marinilactibacillus psychrotolerans 42ea]